MRPFAVAASPSSAAANAAYTGSPEVTNSVTVSQTAGPTSTLSFAWTHVSGSTAISITSPAAATTTFSATPAANTTISAVKRCTVTNGFGQVAHVDVTVTITAGAPALSVGINPGNTTNIHIPAGQPLVLNFSAVVSGGAGAPYTYSWRVFGLGSLNSTTASSVTLTVPAQPHSSSGYNTTVQLTAWDSHGASGIGSSNNIMNWDL